MSRSKIISQMTLSLAACALSIFANPNVIYILADDLGYGEVGYNGQKMIKTPELDTMAAQGMRLTSHYCGSSVCAPSRGALMTGRHPGKGFIRSNSPGYPGDMPLPEGTETVAKLMQRAGYATAAIGKWGLGCFRDSGDPLKQGFDTFFGYLNQSRAHNYYPNSLVRDNGEIPLDGKTYTHDLFTEKAVQFIRTHKEAPFFLYLAYTIPHTKYQVPDHGQYADRDWPENMKIHASMTSRLDRDVGKLRRLLETLGIAENTLIIFSSDNGAHGEQGSEEFFNTSGELRDLKRSMYEGGVKTPTIACWPGTIKAGSTSDHLSAFWDLLPTLSELTGEPFKGITDGISMLPTLRGQPGKQKKHDYLYWELYEKNTPNQAVRMGKWKGVVANRKDGMNIELYDLAKDASEQRDLAKRFPETVKQIRDLMQEAHTPSPYWHVDRKFDPKFACEQTGARYRPKKKKNK